MWVAPLAHSQAATPVAGAEYEHTILDVEFDRTEYLRDFKGHLAYPVGTAMKSLNCQSSKLLPNHLSRLPNSSS